MISFQGIDSTKDSLQMIYHLMDVVWHEFSQYTINWSEIVEGKQKTLEENHFM